MTKREEMTAGYNLLLERSIYYGNRSVRARAAGLYEEEFKSNAASEAYLSDANMILKLRDEWVSEGRI